MLFPIIISFLFELLAANPFCDHYKENGYKVLVHSPNSQNLLFVIGDKYWIINEVNSTLHFTGNDTEPFGSSPILTPTISTLFSIPGTFTIDKKGISDDIFGIYDVRYVSLEYRNESPFYTDIRREKE